MSSHTLYILYNILYNILYLKLLLSDKDAMVVSAVEVGLPLDDSIVFPVSLVQLHTNPLTRGKHRRTHIPDKMKLIIFFQLHALKKPQIRGLYHKILELEQGI